MQAQNLGQAYGRAQWMVSNPLEVKPAELEQAKNFIRAYQQTHPQQPLQPTQPTPPLTNGHAGNVQPLSNASNTVPVSFTPEQIGTLRAQIQAYKHLERGTPVPAYLVSAMKAVPATAELEKSLNQDGDIDRKIVDSAVKTAMAAHDMAMGSIKPEDMPKGPFLEENVNSAIYPHNAYRHPYSHLIKRDTETPGLFQTRLRKLVIPTVMPAGLDSQAIMAERDRFIDARVRRRIAELEAIPSTYGDSGLVSADGAKEEPQDLQSDLQQLLGPSQSQNQTKLKALIELKSLKLREKQRSIRGAVANTLVHGSILPLNRADFRKPKKLALRDARSTEMAERKQRLERERRAKSKHVEQLNVIVTHANEVMAVNRAKANTIARLTNAVSNFHRETEREEKARVERIAKERIRALKANDEVAYAALVDEAKDTRISHLLKQTDSFLSTLASAVRQQQVESGPMPVSSNYDDGPASEATFGASAVIDEDEPKDSAKLDYYAIAHAVSEKITQQPSLLIGGTLKDYQIKGLQWLVSLYNNRLNGILADEMGLGKTIQTISLIAFLIETKRQRGPYLVIVPLSTMTNWSGEFAKWAPAVKMISYKGNPAQRKLLQNDLRAGQFQVLLTTYEYIIKDRPFLSKTKWLHMIMDEGHRMKNANSKLAITLTTYYHSRFRLLLTGTPLQNNLPELWALLNFVLPKIFNSVSSFDEWFNTPFANSGTGDKIELDEEEQLLIIKRLHKVLRPFLLRRLKKDVETELPDKVERVLKVRMSALQSQIYKQMKKFKMISDGGEKGKNEGIRGLSNELMQLRKIVQHPFLFESVEDRMNPGGMIDDKLVRTSGKLELLHKILPKFFKTGHRVLIFFQMTKVMDIMEDFLKMMGWKYLRLDGGTKTEERASFVGLFNEKDSPYKVFILSTRAGGLGLNLQTADTVIIFDSDWNPHADLQAQDRAHRIGQTKAVLILRFITEKSVEEAMYQRARYKLDIDGKVIQAGRFDNKSTQQEQEEFLKAILAEGDLDEESEEAGDLNDDEMNNIISRSDEERVIFHEMDEERERETQQKWTLAGHAGKPPAPLMELHELPECYQSEEPFGVQDVVEVEVEGRGQRKRTTVTYTDGLDDDTWAMALEDAEDATELAHKRKGRPPKQLADVIDSARGTPFSDDSGGPKKKGRGRPPKNEVDYALPVAGKRKRLTKDSSSVTPSLPDEDSEDRNVKRRKTKSNDVPGPVRAQMKKAFNECYQAVVDCVDDTGQKRCDLFQEVPDKRDYPDYYLLIRQPISLSQIRKRGNGNHYKDVQAWRADWTLLFNNARTYNQEGSWVYVNAEEMEKVFNACWNRYILNSGLPGAPGNGGSGAGPSTSYAQGNGYQDAAMDEDDYMQVPRGKRTQILVSDDEYGTPSDA